MRRIDAGSIIFMIMGIALAIAAIVVKNSQLLINQSFIRVMLVTGIALFLVFFIYEVNGIFRSVKKIVLSFSTLKFYYLFFLSGAICFAWEPVLARYISNMSGDIYSVHLSILLGFICFGAVGNFAAIKYKKYLPYLELITGAIMLLMACFYEQIWDSQFIASMPILCTIIVIVMPGIVLGMHVPFYASYIKSKGFSVGYMLYAIGGVAVILAIEIYYAFSPRHLSKIILFFATAQLALGVILLLVCKQNFKDKIEKINIISFVKKYIKEIVMICSFSIASFIIYYWVMRTYSVVFPSFRMNSSILLAASLSMVWLGAMLSAITFKLQIKILKNNFIIFSLMILSVAFSVWSFYPLVHFMQHNFKLEYYIIHVIYFYITAVVMMLPCAFSVLFFSNLITSVMSKVSDEKSQIPSAIFLLVVAISNLIGIFIGVLLVTQLWNNIVFFIVPLIVLPFIFLLMQKNIIKKSIILIIVITMSIIAISKYNSINRIIAARMHSSSMSVENILITPFSTIMTIYNQNKNDMNYPEALYYFVNGYISHDIKKDGEYFMGKLPTYYFQGTKPLKVLVIGAGSGQTALAAGVFAEHTDIVDISPDTYLTLNMTKKYNADLNSLPYFDIYIDDAYNYLKNTTEKYDVIVASQTSPYNYNANKLYTVEFMKLAKNALKKDGVLVGYFFAYMFHEFNFDVDTFLAPVADNFEYIDVWRACYDFFVAYNDKRDNYNYDYKNNEYFKKRVNHLEKWNLESIFELDILRPAYYRWYDIPKGLVIKNYTRPKQNVIMNTRDYNIIEDLAIKDYLKFYHE